MSNKRLHVVVSDEASIKWLESQNNMSASIRLLIQQVAGGGSFGDYVLYCAQQAPSPFNQTNTQTVIPSDSVGELSESPITNEPEVKEVVLEREVIIPTDEVVVEIDTTPVTEPVVRPIVEPEPDVKHSPPEAELAIPINEPNESELDDDSEDVDWDKVEDKKLNRIDRMMADRRRELK